ncbi:MAG: mandelate racemase/muconate lactonizing enzyme family protein [Solirubrobacteraceae bacterium]
MEVAVERLALRLRAPLRTAFGTLHERELLTLRLRGRDGVEGVGEAAPLEPYDGVSPDAVRAALEDCSSLLRASDGEDREALLAACWGAAVLPQAVAAIDLALWDLAGRRAGKPVWALLGAAEGGSVGVNATIGAEDRSGAAGAAAAAAAEGFACVKVKVGVGDDAGRIAAVRAATGRNVAIRIDANGAWTPDEALAHLRVLAPAELELCEESTHGVKELREVRDNSPVPIAMDESAALPGALASGATDAVCLKIARCGGISGLLDAAAIARGARSEVYLASSYDGPIGIAAALHAAAVVRPDRVSGLATLGAFADVDDPFAPVKGRITAPSGPGLGIA